MQVIAPAIYHEAYASIDAANLSTQKSLSLNLSLGLLLALPLFA